MSGKAEGASKLSYDELSTFCYQLGLMMRAGIGSEEGVGLLLEDATDTGTKNLLRNVHDSLSEGFSLSKSLEKTELFPSYMLRMIEIGQLSGKLDKVLEALSGYYERRSDTTRAIRKAVSYPATMSVLVAIIFLVLVSQVLPVFGQVLGQLGLSLSPMAEAMIGIGSSGNVIVAVVVVLLVVMGGVLYFTMRDNAYTNIISKTKTGKLIDRSHFASAMAMMLASGLTVDESMDKAVDLLSESALIEEFKKCRDLTETGTRLPDAAAETGVFSRSQTGIMSAGFRAGVPEAAMEELASRLQEESDENLGQLLGRFEYGLVVVLCVVVGVVLMSVMLPLIGVLSSIGG